MAGSAQTHKSMNFIWIVWSTLYVYLWHTYGEAKEKKKSRVSEIDVLVQKQLYNEWNLPVIEFSNLKS